MSPAGRFDKYEGLGNDFVVVEARDPDAISPERARRLCDRRFGIGADGVLLLLPASASSAVARMRVINSDGSIPEMCGNGLRCAALHLARQRGVEKGELTVETDAGPRACAIERQDGVAMVLCEMGAAKVGEDVLVDLGGERISLTRANVGNPHAVSFVFPSEGEFARLGPPLSTAPAFAEGANIEFARWTGEVLEVKVWERGAGATLACGTGACAAVAVAYAKRVLTAPGPVKVRLPGGDLFVTVDPETSIATLRGPARHVFSGMLGAS
jgi:diaminopimelate epimerase